MKKVAYDIAGALLETGAVRLDVKNPFTFVSGIKSPIYCDNRKMIGFPKERTVVVKAFVEKIKEKDVEIIAGTATAGIPWAAFIAQELNLPMAYIRGEKKKHGAGKQIEGAELEGKKVIIIEDLISTGGSSIKAVDAAREAGAKSVEVVSIFSYEFESAFENFKNGDINWESLSSFSALIELAKEKEYLTLDEAEIALKWNKNPNEWGK